MIHLTTEAMRWIDEPHREFTARYLGDLSKAIFAVALASKLFIELPPWLRVTLTICGVMFFVLAYIIHPGQKGARER